MVGGYSSAYLAIFEEDCYCYCVQRFACCNASDHNRDFGAGSLNYCKFDYHRMMKRYCYTNGASNHLQDCEEAFGNDYYTLVADIDASKSVVDIGGYFEFQMVGVDCYKQSPGYCFSVDSRWQGWLYYCGTKPQAQVDKESLEGILDGIALGVEPKLGQLHPKDNGACIVVVLDGKYPKMAPDLEAHSNQLPQFVNKKQGFSKTTVPHLNDTRSKLHGSIPFGTSPLCSQS